MIKNKFKIIRYEKNNYKEIEDISVVEYRLKIYVNNRPVGYRLCLKEKLDNMIIGFLLTEGYISKYKDIEKIEFISKSENHGECYCIVNKNKKYINNHSNNYRTDAKEINEAMEEFTQRSSLFKETGGVHSCGILKNSEIIYFADDIGRQNALDKILGYIVKNSEKMDEILILFSGRITTEVLEKLSLECIEGIISKAAVTKDAAIKGVNMKILLVGFARNKRFNLYSGGEKLKDY
ncbi:MAG: formate dehydrogenase accessory sulfurtransferase FdhD [Bacillota bacterium]|nr:formate dehydrogenase accessory sulfurtransferase FdhD [Bacillota bacterium]